MLPSHYKILFGIWKVQSKKQLQFVFLNNLNPNPNYFLCLLAYQSRAQRCPDSQEKVRLGFLAVNGTGCVFADESAAVHPQCGLCVASQVHLQTRLGVFNSKYRHLGFFQRLFTCTGGPSNICNYKQITRILNNFMLFFFLSLEVTTIPSTFNFTFMR